MVTSPTATPTTQGTDDRVRPPRHRSYSLRTREAVAGYLVIAPAVLGFVLFLAGPVVASLVLSLTEYDILSSARWVGFDNYAALVRDPLFWQSLKVTATAASIGLPLNLLLSLGLALLLNRRIRGVSVWRTVYYLPSVVSGAAVAVLWVWILNPEFGVVNSVLRAVGIEGPNWLGDSRTALLSLIAVGLWSIGGNVIIYLAGLQGIPTELYEAAAIDGAGTWRRFLHVTLPLLTPVIFFNVVLGLIYSLQWFTEPFVMTGGGPENSTLTYMLYAYRNAFIFLKMGYALALVWTFFLLVLILTLLVFRSSPMWVHYEGVRRR
jgi:multiple sugar transport system permease protein